MSKFCDYILIRQVAVLFDLNMKNTYRIMKQLEPYYNMFKDDGVNVYYLNKTGREIVGCEKVRKKLTTASHYIMRNDLYIYLGQPKTWQNEVRLKYVYNKNDPNSRKIIVVPDAHYQTHKAILVEVDYMQKMYKNKIKVEKYRRLIEKGVFQKTPEILWVTTTEYRKKRLLELCDGLDAKVYLRGDLL